MTNQTVSETSQSLQGMNSNAFHLALARAAATMANPAYGNRLQLATELVRHGAVTLHDDGTATVVSNDHTYDLVDTCTCEDSRRRSPSCKHVLAVQLLNRTTRHLASGQNGNGTQDVSSVPSAPARSQAWAVSEAPASCCLKFKIDGIEIMYTMRDIDDNALFPRVKQVLARLQEKIGQTGAETPRHDHTPPCRQTATGSLSATSPTPSAEATDEPSALRSTSDTTPAHPQGWCATHDTQMRRFSSETGCWWSHRLGNGTWCKGK